jgi:hypothetical protein
MMTVIFSDNNQKSFCTSAEVELANTMDDTRYFGSLDFLLIENDPGGGCPRSVLSVDQNRFLQGRPRS